MANLRLPALHQSGSKSSRPGSVSSSTSGCWWRRRCWLIVNSISNHFPFNLPFKLSLEHARLIVSLKNRINVFDPQKALNTHFKFIVSSCTKKHISSIISTFQTVLTSGSFRLQSTWDAVSRVSVRCATRTASTNQRRASFPFSSFLSPIALNETCFEYFFCLKMKYKEKYEFAAQGSKTLLRGGGGAASGRAQKVTFFD